MDLKCLSDIANKKYFDIELIHSKQLFHHEQARMVHWITEPIRSNPWIRSVFSVLLRDVLNGTVGSRAENITKYSML